MTSAPLDRIRACLQAALRLSDVETAAISRDTTPLDVPAWTSLAHVELVLLVEREFGVAFEAEEIVDLASVAAIVKALDERRAG